MTTEPTPAGNPPTNITEQPATLPPLADQPSTGITEQPATPPAPTVVDPPPALAPTWPLKVDFVILALLLILSFFLASFAATNSDLWTHLAIGKRYSEGKFGFGVDPFSWASEGVYWVHHAWLYSWLVYGIYSFCGGTGVVVAKAIVFTTSIAILASIGWNTTNRWFVLICLLMATLAVSQRIFMQPIVVSLLFLSITLFVLDQVGVFALKREGSAPDRARWLWYLPPLFALWANFDHWFILGPILVALCWGATGLKKWFPAGNLIPGKTLGQVVGVSLLACLVNPHHLRVFQLPPELAYFVLLLTDPVGLPLPDALIGAGRTLKELSKIDSTFSWGYSSLDLRYWQDANYGLNTAGLAGLPLLILGLLSFVLVGLVRAQSDAPSLQAGRFLPWLVFAVFALVLYRMIPFFALIAAPFTAMTLGEYLAWWQASNGVEVGRRDRGLHLARLLCVPFLLLLLFWAWPGWLHGPTSVNEFSSPRRVAWTMRADPAMQRVGETLQALREKNECRNVFNVSRDLGNYLPWFAPDVKYYLDTRYSLYAGQATILTKAREALIDPAKPADDWQALFKKHDIDQAVMANPLQNGNIVKWWFDEDNRWRQRYADTRMAVFSWSGADRSWPPGQTEDDFNRQAFGEVPARERPPAHGTPPPPVLSVTTLYLDGVGTLPAGVGELNVQKIYYGVKKQAQPFTISPAPYSTCSYLFFCASLANVQAVPGAMTLDASFALLHQQFKPGDLGPPALPIIMLRGARRVVAENPQDPRCHIALMEASGALYGQEEYWTSGFAQAEPRTRVRNFQFVASLFTLTQLRPDEFDYQHRLAMHYWQRNLFDLALEHMLLAEKAYITKKSAEREDPKKIAAQIKGFQEARVEPLERTVRLRMAKFKEKSGALSPYQQIGFALGGTYVEVNSKGIQEGSPLGLAKKANDLVAALDPKALKDDESRALLMTRMELYVEMGRIDVLADFLKDEEQRKALPPFMRAKYQVIVAGALGDTEGMDKALRTLEGFARAEIPATDEALTKTQRDYAASIFLASAQPSAMPLIANIWIHTGPVELTLEQVFRSWGQLHNSLYNVMTLRGIVALEAGDTKKAREIFEATLLEAGDEHAFSERPMVIRYLHLLKQQKR